MKIDRIQIKVRDLIDGYEEKGAEGIEGVVAYGGKLDVRPAYQREYIYGEKDRDEVLRSVKKHFPINIMYWAKNDNDRYEVMDGQQRTISICRYAAAKDPKNLRSFEQCFAVDDLYFFNLTSDIQDSILDYELDIYVCDGEPSEILAWFKVINIAGKVLSEQELRNTSYTGSWLSDAKLYFSKPKCMAANIGKDYLSGSPIRQEYLETAIRWISARDGLESVDKYMALHQKDENASAIKLYFKRVIDWIKDVFPVYRKEMKGIEWGLLYNRFKDAELDPIALEERIKQLMIDDDVTNKKGIYTYILTGEEKHLSIRAFPDGMKRQIYERQAGICPMCAAEGKDKHWEIEEMHADHKIPWSRGGHTTLDNGQMLCRDHNLQKSDI